MRFVADENVQRFAAPMLTAYDPANPVDFLTDHFERGTPDLDWIPALARWRPKPVILTGDANILRNAAEREALKEAKLIFVCLKNWNIPREVYAWKIVKVWPAVLESCSRCRKPTIFEVSMRTLKVKELGSISG